MTADQNETIFLQFIDELRRGNLAIIDEVCSLNFAFHSPNWPNWPVESRSSAVALGLGICCGRRLSPNAGVSIQTIAPFPLPAHRTGRADLLHPALRWNSPKGSRSSRPQRAQT